MTVLQPLKFGLRGKRTFTNRCIWCGDLKPQSKSHLFSEYLGSNYVSNTSCEECNNFLGTRVEPALLENGLIASALVKFRLKTQKEAYGNVEKFDTKSGAKVNITKSGKAVPVPKEFSEFHFRGPIKDVQKFTLRLFRRHRPKSQIGPLKEFLKNTDQKEISYDGMFFQKSRMAQRTTSIIFQMPRDIDTKAVFKIVNEFLMLRRVYVNKNFINVMNPLYRVNSGGGVHRIYFSSEIDYRIADNTQGTFDKFENLEKVPFEPVHYAVLRLSKSFVLYLEIVFFGQIRTFFIIDKFKKLDSYNMALIDKAHCFPIHSSELVYEDYQNVELKDQTKWGDDFVDAGYENLCKLKKGYDEPR